jgi:hypothetical protein
MVRMSPLLSLCTRSAVAPYLSTFCQLSCRLASVICVIVFIELLREEDYDHFMIVPIVRTVTNREVHAQQCFVIEVANCQFGLNLFDA